MAAPHAPAGIGPEEAAETGQRRASPEESPEKEPKLICSGIPMGSDDAAKLCIEQAAYDGVTLTRFSPSSSAPAKAPLPGAKEVATCNAIPGVYTWSASCML